MEHWNTICTRLSMIFKSNMDMNFGIYLTPDAVSDYIQQRALFFRVAGDEPADIDAALFVTHDGECGFIAFEGVRKSSYQFLINEFNSFVINLPDDLRTKLWCRAQKNNPISQRLIRRLGFIPQQESETSKYYTFGGIKECH